MKTKKDNELMIEPAAESDYDSDWLIRIPDEFQKQLIYKIDRLEEENNMPYATSWEKMEMRY